MRSNYWTIGRFADWLRGTVSPHAETMQGWRDWRKAAKTAHPIRYWLAETGLRNLQNFFCYIPDKLNDVRYYINNRWVSRSHALTAHPRDIAPGSWSDVGHRFLPCMFNELVDFVEIEQAWHHVMWDNEARKKFSVPWWRSGWLRWRTWRCPEAGLAHLDWASSLTFNEDWLSPTDPKWGAPTPQAINAMELKKLYTWWTVTRPARPVPEEVSGWSAMCAERRTNDDGDFLGFEDKTEFEKKETSRVLNIMHKIESDYEEEDEAMMIRLIKIRSALWT